ncbi:MAG TPA: serine/threonine-protein kinase [Polyangiaceae bacterium]|nr:serine/threonine-protein kinase [Polyangiaceae bacterium]
MAKVDVGVVIAGKYALTRLLGAGGMGQVWLARHTALHQDFAIKLLVPPESDFENAATSRRRFENEAQIAAALSRMTRHIVAVIDFGEDQGMFYLVMELLQGITLEARLERGPLGIAEVGSVIADVAKGAEVAHSQGIVHRDLKPANVFLAREPDGTSVAKLFDFGIARLSRRIVPARSPGASADPTKLTVRGVVLGTPAYMSPEQAMGETTDARADVWALAVMAFEALAGDIPFAGATLEKTLIRICNCRATPLRELLPGATPELDALFAKAFAPDIAQRFQTASEFVTALTRCLPAAGSGRMHVPVSQQATTMAAMEAAPPARSRSSAWLVAASAALVLALATASVRYAAQGHPAPASILTPSPSPSPSPSLTPLPSPSPSPSLTPSPPPSTRPTPFTSASSKRIDRSAVF